MTTRTFRPLSWARDTISGNEECRDGSPPRKVISPTPFLAHQVDTSEKAAMLIRRPEAKKSDGRKQ